MNDYIARIVEDGEVPAHLVSGWMVAGMLGHFNKGLQEYIECEYFYYMKLQEERGYLAMPVEAWMADSYARLELVRR